MKQVKDLVLPHCDAGQSQLWRRFDPWSGNLHMPQVHATAKEKKKMQPENSHGWQMTLG